MTHGRPRLCFVVESGTDVRLVDGLAERSDLTILGRAIPGGAVISQPPSDKVETTVSTSSRARFAASVMRHLLRHRAEIDRVIVQGYGLAALAANAAARITGTPTFLLVCSPAERYYRRRVKARDPGKPYRAYELLLLDKVARLNALLGREYIVLSHHLADEVRRHGERARVSIVPVYGVDTTRFRPPDSTKALIRTRLGLPEDGTLLFFSSRIAPEKDAATLLAAVRQLAATGRKLRILHLSGGYHEFRAAAEALSLGDAVVAADAVHPIDALPAYYQASDLCVQASWEEGLGFSPLEALACEVPVVASAVGGLRETIRDGETGWTYEPGNVAGLAAAVEAVLADPNEATRRARAGRAMVEAEFERQIVFDRLMEVLAGS